MSQIFKGKAGYETMTYPEVTAMLVTPDRWANADFETFIDAYVLNSIDLLIELETAKKTGSAAKMAGRHLMINASGDKKIGTMVGVQFGTVVIKQGDNWLPMLYENFKAMYDGDFALLDEEYAQYIEWASFVPEPEGVSNEDVPVPNP